MPETDPEKKVTNVAHNAPQGDISGPPTKPAPVTGTAAPNGQRRFSHDVILAIIEHGNRSIIILVIAFLALITIYCARDPLGAWLSKTGSLRVASFEWKVREEAARAQVSSELSKLRSLDNGQLQLFLIIGSFREKKAAGDFNINYTGEELTKPNLDKLQELGLVSDVGVAPNGNFIWTVTPTGYKLHRVLFENTIEAIKAAATNCNCQ